MLCFSLVTISLAHLIAINLGLNYQGSSIRVDIIINQYFGVIFYFNYIVDNLSRTIVERWSCPLQEIRIKARVCPESFTNKLDWAGWLADVKLFFSCPAGDFLETPTFKFNNFAGKSILEKMGAILTCKSKNRNWHSKRYPFSNSNLPLGLRLKIAILWFPLVSENLR